jgi:hypothetical protein
MHDESKAAQPKKVFFAESSAPPAPKSPLGRKRILAQALREELDNDARLLLESNYDFVIAPAQREYSRSLPTRPGVPGASALTLVHVLLTVLSAGLWLIPWAIIALIGRRRHRPRRISVNGYGELHAQVLGARPS